MTITLTRTSTRSFNHTKQTPTFRLAKISNKPTTGNRRLFMRDVSSSGVLFGTHLGHESLMTVAFEIIIRINQAEHNIR
jgi:hypothetical protein